jgi:hypothetical protein
LTYGLSDTIGVFDAALRFKAFDELGPETAEQHPREKLLSEFPFGHKVDRARQHRQQDQRIEITGMVDDEHTGSVAGEMLQPAHVHWKTEEPQQELRCPSGDGLAPG